MTKSIKRVFLDWNRPVLLSAIDWIARELAVGDRVDLTDWIVVLPGARARRRFLQLMDRECRERGLLWLPGLTVTVGQLPEQLYQSERRLAGELECRMAWAAAVRDVGVASQKRMFPELSLDNEDALLEIATMLESLHRQLGADAISFASVYKHVAQLERFSGTARWEVLAEIQNAYYRRLDAHQLWDRQAARNVAARRDGGCKSGRRILMIATADLNHLVKLMLAQVADKVTALVGAGADCQAGFDATGSLVPEWWRERPIELREEQIRVVDRPLDQAFAVSSFLRGLPDGMTTDEITVCAPDDDVAVHVQRLLASEGVPTRRLTGVPLSRSRVGRLIEATREWLGQQSFGSLAALVRHPDMFAAITRKLEREDWLDSLDEFQNLYLPGEIRLDQFRKTKKPKSRGGKLLTEVGGIFEALERMLGELMDSAEPEASMDRLASARVAVAWSRYIESVYGDTCFDSATGEGRQMIDALQAVASVLEEIAVTSVEWMQTLEPVTAGDYLLESLEQNSFVEDDNDAAIELAGWLDLALDDSPAMIVTGFNEHNMPSSSAGHALLPNSLCRELGLQDNERRYARDAWVLSVILNCREYCWMVAGRRDAQNTPRLPSRLMFATAADDAESLRRRAAGFFGFKGSDSQQRWMRSTAVAAIHQQLEIPRPHAVPEINRISVTRLRDYLKCPYRFWLSVVMELEIATDDVRELDGGAFGSLAHDVLEAFGNSEVANSFDAEEMQRFLRSALTRLRRKMLPFQAMPAAEMQIANLAKRLDQFAVIQAGRRAEGWQIVRVEPKVEWKFDVDGRPFTIVGKIDRVDRHEDGRLAVWDYKTSDSGKTAEQAHRNKKEWIDFQLPLYRHLLTEVLPDATDQIDTINLGYVLLPRDLGAIKFDQPDWSGAELRVADEMVKKILRDIRAGKFWPMSERPPEFSDDLAAICQDAVFERWGETVGQGGER